MTAITPTQAQLARALGIDKALVTRYKARGMPVDSIDAALAWKAKNVRARAGSAADGSPGDARATQDDYNASRARREAADAQRAEVELQRLLGQLIELEPAVTAAFTAFRSLRDSGMVLGRKLAPRVSAMSDAREIQLVIDSAMREMFDGFAKRTLPDLVRKLAGDRTDEFDLADNEEGAA